ncbi:hypothetical protein EUTSA_v10018645mg [Eutrema salsugineum]|uniref:FBD domain-containing protein n=1 Tax=Eutrema salsugineum TaxID=72664 RepID=V4JTP5_EUTSA|nr:FBD-associated F-box protein At4g10400 [Eutrema salsugineum]ESQ28695.1 hypothetical protein EUTSA_v10018645mg [Eutrema salsugineum]
MDRISDLSDELLIKILTSVPTKLAVSTSILSKRWECLWKWLPKLEYDDTDYSVSECKMLRCFLDRNLPLHRALIIESFRLHLKSQRFKPADIKLWLLFAVSRCPRELEVSYSRKRTVSSSSLYTCKALVILKLSGAILVDVPRMVSLPSLKTLQLRDVTYSDKESLQRLLAICPVLEELSVDLGDGGKMEKLTVSVPSLQSLTFNVPHDCGVDELVIDTPSLKYIKLEDRKGLIYLVANMPELREAYIDVKLYGISNLMGSITSVKRLTTCFMVFVNGFVFNQLEHLKICQCHMHTSNLLVWLLKVSPNLQVLDLYVMKDHHYEKSYRWCPLSAVPPECMLSSLRIFNWSVYFGRPAERDFAVYILENARLLETATISCKDWYVPKLEMIKELSSSSRASTTCRLVFD